MDAVVVDLEVFSRNGLAAGGAFFAVSFVEAVLVVGLSFMRNEGIVWEGLGAAGANKALDVVCFVQCIKLLFEDGLPARSALFGFFGVAVLALGVSVFVEILTAERLLTVMAHEAFLVERPSQGIHKLPRNGLLALMALLGKELVVTADLVVHVIFFNVLLVNQRLIAMGAFEALFVPGPIRVGQADNRPGLDLFFAAETILAHLFFAIQESCDYKLNLIPVSNSTTLSRN